MSLLCVNVNITTTKKKSILPGDRHELNVTRHQLGRVQTMTEIRFLRIKQKMSRGIPRLLPHNGNTNIMILTPYGNESETTVSVSELFETLFMIIVKSITAVVRCK